MQLIYFTAAATDMVLSSNQNKVVHRIWNSNLIFTLSHKLLSFVASVNLII